MPILLVFVAFFIWIVKPKLERSHFLQISLTLAVNEPYESEETWGAVLLP